MKPSKRKVVSRAPAKTVRIINLRGLLPHPVEAESSLEADYIRRAAFCPSTSSVIAQPFILPVSPRGYTPDFLQQFKTTDLKAVVEVKTAKMVTEYAEQFDRAADFLLQKGYSFYVLTEKQLRSKNIHQRTLLIRRYAKAAYPEAERQKITAILADFPAGLPIGSLVRKTGACREIILHLMAWRIITSGPNLHVDDSAVVTLSKFSETSDVNEFERWFGVSAWGANSGGKPCAYP